MFEVPREHPTAEAVLAINRLMNRSDACTHFSVKKPYAIWRFGDLRFLQTRLQSLHEPRAEPGDRTICEKDLIFGLFGPISDRDARGGGGPVSGSFLYARNTAAPWHFLYLLPNSSARNAASGNTRLPLVTQLKQSHTTPKT
jgi:hypothetical protein